MKHLALSALALAATLAFTPAVDAQRSRPKDIVDTAVSAGSFETLVAAVKAAGLVDALKGDGPLTVFAPTDEAFAKLPKGTVENLLKPENKDQLVAILTYHVVPGKVLARDAIVAAEAGTLQGDEVAFSIGDGRLRVNESNVVANDIDCSNGVIHVIDQVLLPPAAQGRKVVGIYTGSVGSHTRRDLGLDSHEGILITGIVDGSNAQKTDLKSDDVIVTINGKKATSDVLSAAKERAGVGGTIELLIARRVKVKVGVENG